MELLISFNGFCSVEQQLNAERNTSTGGVVRNPEIPETGLEFCLMPTDLIRTLSRPSVSSFPLPLLLVGFPNTVKGTVARAGQLLGNWQSPHGLRDPCSSLRLETTHTFYKS